MALVWLCFTVAGITGPLGFAICVICAFLLIYGVICWQQYGVLATKDRLATLAIWTGALVAFIPLVAVIAYVIFKGAAVVFAHFPHFFLADMTDLTATSPVTAVGAGAAIVGTIEQVGLATLFTVPLGILTATYLVNNRNTFAKMVSNVVDAMTGSPAIIAGLFIYLLWVVPQKEAGQTGFAAALALSVMMLPIVTRASQEVISIVPGSLTEASLALGAPMWRSTLRVLLPTARVGLITAMILGIARVAGETAPVLFTAGGNPSYNWNPFSGKQDDLPLRVYELIFQPGVNTTRDAWGVAFVLVLVVLTLFILARLIGAKKPGPSGFTVPWRSRREFEEEEAPA
ncbi:MAG TPA: phosphate ABC transporter permease PstA [Acidimicrobiales bacterium]|nr:phosphate ABC transporter permease PstA [Acidimicrobiales bacterium]